MKMNGFTKMLFIKPSEFDFVEHWGCNDKRYIASFLSKMSKKYYHIDSNEFKSYMRYKVFLEYKKHTQNLKVNSSLLGKLRSGLYELNKKEINKNEIRNNEIIEKQYQNLFIYEDEKSMDLEMIISDIKKICCEKTAECLLKKINKEKMTRWEYAYLEKNKGKIIEYLSI
ncbi:hypothetical protein N5912_00725 [Arcobacter lacus]|uniref:hypothetical protein n=1 Tax=Arcobacter lacus TaxID=1912876 RepID=UPI0021BA5EA7|nr:hypothetical protein [Arcobacter lacus]MCT7910342.1 hypothetical protein [Arcobacter lacus]